MQEKMQAKLPLAEWRAKPAIVREERPSKLKRARTLGYKAKPGFVVARVRLRRGGRRRPRRRKGRRPKRMTIRKTLAMSYRWIAEQRAARKYKGLEVLNSYWLAQDALYYWFDVILVDPRHPQIRVDKDINWICAPEQRGRVFRGLTNAARKSRGLREKGKRKKRK